MPAQAKKVFLESDGVVVIEAESSSSKPGKWAGKTDLEGFTGKGYIEYTGNKPAGGPIGSTLVMPSYMLSPSINGTPGKAAR